MNTLKIFHRHTKMGMSNPKAIPSNVVQFQKTNRGEKKCRANTSTETHSFIREKRKPAFKLHLRKTLHIILTI